MLSRDLKVNRPLLQPKLGVPPNWNSVPNSLRRVKALAFIMVLKIFEQTSISITPLHLLGSERSPFFGTGTH